MRTNTLKSVLFKLFSVVGTLFLTLNSVHAAFQSNVPVTVGLLDASSGTVIGQRGFLNCEIKANGVLMQASSVVKAFICQLKMLGATDFGKMSIDTARPGFVAGYVYASPAGRLANQPPNMVRAIYVFYYPELPADRNATYFATTFSSTGNNEKATNGMLMPSPDEAIVAATAAFQSRTIEIGYFPGNRSYYYLDPLVCSYFGGIYAGRSINILAGISIM